MKNAPDPPGFKSRKMIAAEYGIDPQTLRRKLKQHGIDLPSGLVDLEWQKKIYEALKYPPCVSKKDFEDI
ncbi:MAG: hypothetical protein ACE5FF_13040 [Saprospiraceae bacterium]